jgi:hypothetical protein
MNLDDFQARFSEALRGIKEERSERTVTEILIGIQGYANSMVPIKTSNLANSQFRYVRSSAFGYLGKVGYGAKYAAAVHEAPGKLKGSGKLRDKNRPGWGVYWAPNGEPGFLRKGIELFVANELDNTIERNMRV